MRFREIISYVKIEYTNWIFSSKMIIVLCVCAFIDVFVVDPIKQNSEIMKNSINILEPFIAALNSGMVLLIMPLGFLTIIADFPKMNNSTLFYVFRIGKKKWLCSQIIVLILMSVSYVTLILFSSVLSVLAIGFVDGNWSIVTTKFAMMFPELSGNFGSLLLPENLYNQLTLSSSFTLSLLLLLEYLLLIGVILLLFSIVNKKKMGIIVCGSVISLGAALCSINSKLMWVFPMSHSIVWIHYTEYLREPIVPIEYSFFYFITIILITLVFCFLSVARTNFVYLDDR